MPCAGAALGHKNCRTAAVSLPALMTVCRMNTRSLASPHLLTSSDLSSSSVSLLYPTSCLTVALPILHPLLCSCHFCVKYNFIFPPAARTPPGGFISSGKKNHSRSNLLLSPCGCSPPANVSICVKTLTFPIPHLCHPHTSSCAGPQFS